MPKPTVEPPKAILLIGDGFFVGCWLLVVGGWIQAIQETSMVMPKDAGPNCGQAGEKLLTLDM